MVDTVELARYIVDTDQVQAALQAVAAAEVNTLAQTDALGKGQKDLAKLLKQARTPAQKTADMIRRLSDGADKATKETDAYANAMKTLTQKLVKQQKPSRSLTDMMTELSAKTQKSNEQLGKIGSTLSSLGLPGQNVINIFQTMNAKTAEATQASGQAVSGWSKGSIALSVLGGAALGVLAGLGKLGAEFAANAKALDNIARSAGVATTELSRYQTFQKRTGLSTQELGQAFQKLNVKISDATDGKKKAVDMLRKLGISEKELGSAIKTPDQALMRIADTLAETSDKTIVLAQMSKVFGDAVAQKLAPNIDRGAEAIREMLSENDELGLSMSQRGVDAALKYTEAMDRLALRTKGARTEIGTFVAETITANIDAVELAIGTYRRWLGIQSRTPQQQEMITAALAKLNIQLREVNSQIKASQLNQMFGRNADELTALEARRKQLLAQIATQKDIDAGIDRGVTALKESTGITKKATKSTAGLVSAVAAMVNLGLDPAEKAAAKYEKGLGKLNRALQAGAIDAGIYQQALRGLEIQRDGVDAATKSWLKLKQEVAATAAATLDIRTPQIVDAETLKRIAKARALIEEPVVFDIVELPVDDIAKQVKGAIGKSVIAGIGKMLAGQFKEGAENLKNAAEEGGNKFKEALAKAMAGIGKAVKVGKIISSIGASLVGMIIDIGTKLADILAEPGAVEGFISNLANAFPRAMDGLIQGIPVLLTGIIDAIPDLIEAIKDRIPDLIAAVIDGAKQLATFIADNADVLVGLALDFVMAIVDAIPELIPQLVIAAGALVSAIIAKVPEITIALVKEIPSIVAALARGVVSLVMSILAGVLDAVGLDRAAEKLKDKAASVAVSDANVSQGGPRTLQLAPFDEAKVYRPGNEPTSEATLELQLEVQGLRDELRGLRSDFARLAAELLLSRHMGRSALAPAGKY